MTGDPYTCLKIQLIYIQLGVEKQCGENFCVSGTHGPSDQNPDALTAVEPPFLLNIQLVVFQKKKDREYRNRQYLSIFTFH